MLNNVSFVLSLIIPVIRCQLNVTEQSQYDETTDLSLPPFWCPSGYRLLNKNNEWFQWCKPSADLMSRSLLNMLTSDNVTVNQDETVCLSGGKFDSEFHPSNCRRVRLSQKDYRIKYTDYTLYEIRTNAFYSLGSYYYFAATAETIICRDQVLVEDDVNGVFMTCTPYPLKDEKYEVRPNRSIYIPTLKQLVRFGYYSVSGYTKNETPAVDTVCLGMDHSTDSCKEFGVIESDYFDLKPDLSLSINYGGKIALPLGHYVLTSDHSKVLYCADLDKPRRPVTRHLFASAFVVSAGFLFVTLVVHLFYPSLNYHAMALLCHIVSLLVMYVTMAILTLGIYYPTKAARLMLFSVTYVSTLAAFFWLNVLAYELWRVFSTIKGVPGGLGYQRQKRRIFFLKCCYAWGIPLIMCFIILGLAHEPSLTKMLGLTLVSDQLVWFNTTISKLLFFYFPITIILVQNATLFGITVWNIKKASKGIETINKKVSKQLFRVSVKLFIVMGIFWFAEVISWLLEGAADEAVWYPTDLINALQGVAVFIVYVFKKTTWKILKEKWRGDKKGIRCSTEEGKGKYKRPASTGSNTELTTTNTSSV